MNKIQILSAFISENWHSCPFDDKCGIDFERACTGWNNGQCGQCLADNCEKLPVKNKTFENKLPIFNSECSTFNCRECIRCFIDFDNKSYLCRKHKVEVSATQTCPYHSNRFR